MLTSLHNPKVKYAIKLRERRERERSGLMLVEGCAELALALAGGAKPQTVFCCPELVVAGSPAATALLDQLRAAQVELVEVAQPVFEKMAYRENPDGWLAVLPHRRRALADLSLGSAPLLLVVEAVEKPGNLGAMLRSAEAAGVSALIVCDPTTDVSNPNVVRSSKGTLFSLPVAEASTPETLDWLHARHIAIVAATPQADQLYTQANLRGPVAIAVGAEANGLSQAWLNQADVRVRIPMAGRVNSLNVAAAATLLIYEAVRQRGGR